MTTAERISKLKPNQPIKSWRADKKMVVLASNGKKTKVIHFGQVGYSDFTKHKNAARRKRYLKRSAGIRNAKGQLTKDDIFSANYWARKILW